MRWTRLLLLLLLPPSSMPPIVLFLSAFFALISQSRPFFFTFPPFLLSLFSTNRRAWTRLPWPMPPFWMAAGAGPAVPWLAQWALWLSVFPLSLLSLTLSTPQRWASETGRMLEAGELKNKKKTNLIRLSRYKSAVFGVLCCSYENLVTHLLSGILLSLSRPTNCLLSDYWS